jgi:hypothetical protein
MQYSTVIALGAFFLLLTSCSHSLFKNNEKPEESRELAQKAIFGYLQQPNFFFDMLTGKGLSKIDPLLCLRETLSTNGKVYFGEPMHSDLLKYPLPKKTCQLVIPDSLNGKYRYTDDDKDYEHDYAIIYQFSLLLSTKEPNIFLMERHIWANTCEEDDCVRFLSRGYLKFKIEGQEIVRLDDVILYNQIDFIGFGGFWRKKMDEALPGEKIIKFGH